jgi:hypothetical protein
MSFTAREALRSCTRTCPNATLLRSLLGWSAAHLKCKDPLLCDLGAHRWLEEETSYSDWLAWVLERLHCANREVPVVELHGFELRTWEDVAVALRRAIPIYASEIEAAMMLGLVAAVERNLLGFETANVCRIWQGQSAWVTPRLLEYLRRTTEVTNECPGAARQHAASAGK